MSQRAHAMKNCLAVVTAVLELVEQELCESARPRLHRAREASERLLGLRDDDLRRPGDAPSMHDRHVDVSALLLNVVSHLQDRADARGVTLRCASAGDRSSAIFIAVRSTARPVSLALRGKRFGEPFAHVGILAD